MLIRGQEVRSQVDRKHWMCKSNSHSFAVYIRVHVARVKSNTIRHLATSQPLQLDKIYYFYPEIPIDNSLLVGYSKL